MELTKAENTPNINILNNLEVVSLNADKSSIPPLIILSTSSGETFCHFLAASSKILLGPCVCM